MKKQNAANNIDAQSRSLRDLLKGKHYKVGYFQREYKWTRDNIENLIIDLERSFMSNWDAEHTQADVVNYDKYYMGPVVLFQDKTEISIVDGQQRLTSFTLLMIFLNRELNLHSDQKNKLIDYIYSDYYGTESYNFNIAERVDIFNHLFRGQSYNEEILENESCENLLQRYSDIIELFPSTLLHKDVLPLFITWITEKLVFVEIMTQTSDSAYTIFETMNDRGLHLTPTEMLKSFLLSKAGDDDKIKKLDSIWKTKINALKKYNQETDLDFFRAWFRARYAKTIRTSEKGSINEDFEKIGTRFHAWVQENDDDVLNLQNAEDFYFFVHSDFNFYADIYLKLLEYEYTEFPHEHDLRLLSYKGISHSLSYPLILAPLLKTDDEITLSTKIDLTVQFVDAFSAYRLLLNDPITHSSIRNGIYTKVKEIRSADIESLRERLSSEIETYRARFLQDVSYLPFNVGFAKYILARLYKNSFPEHQFENLYFQRRKDSFVLYQFLKPMDVDSEVRAIPSGLKEIFLSSLCSWCLIPKDFAQNLDSLQVVKRIEFLCKHDYLFEFTKSQDIDLKDLKAFFMSRNHKLKEKINTLWKIK